MWQDACRRSTSEGFVMRISEKAAQRPKSGNPSAMSAYPFDCRPIAKLPSRQLRARSDIRGNLKQKHE